MMGTQGFIMLFYLPICMFEIFHNKKSFKKNNVFNHMEDRNWIYPPALEKLEGKKYIYIYI